MERMLRMIWLGDSSNEKKSTRSPRRAAAWAKLAATMVLPVPGVPVSRMLLPRKNPRPPSIASSRGMPVAIRSFDTLWFSPSEVMGSTLMPVVADEKGKFVGAVQRAAVFHHAQMPRGNLIVEPGGRAG